MERGAVSDCRRVSGGLSVCGMAILSVDLGWLRWSDIGAVIMNRAHTGAIDCEVVRLDPPGLDDDPMRDRGPVNASVLAGRLNHLSNVRGIHILVLDGPQAWKSKQNGYDHARAGERELNTAAKTGLPGLVKPVSYRPIAEFCIDVYDALVWRNWRRLDSADTAIASKGRVLVESAPQAAWKALGLKPLRSKRKATVSELAEAYAALNRMFTIRTNMPPNHDQLQAIVGGLAGLAIEAQEQDGLRLVGAPPRREDGDWREGFIALPVPPRERGRAAAQSSDELRVAG